jgi:hypothetical protein
VQRRPDRERGAVPGRQRVAGVRVCLESTPRALREPGTRGGLRLCQPGSSSAVTQRFAQLPRELGRMSVSRRTNPRTLWSRRSSHMSTILKTSTYVALAIRLASHLASSSGAACQIHAWCHPRIVRTKAAAHCQVSECAESTHLKSGAHTRRLWAGAQARHTHATPTRGAIYLESRTALPSTRRAWVTLYDAKCISLIAAAGMGAATSIASRSSSAIVARMSESRPA